MFPKESLFGFALRCAINSGIDLAGTEGLIVKAPGAVPNSVIGMKSLRLLKGKLVLSAGNTENGVGDPTSRV